MKGISEPSLPLYEHQDPTELQETVDRWMERGCRPERSPGEIPETLEAGVCVQSLSVRCACRATRELLRVGAEQLLDNAVRFSAHEPRPAGRAPNVVRDHGVCFDMSFTETPFRPFQRVHLDIEFPGIGISSRWGAAPCGATGRDLGRAAPEAGHRVVANHGPGHASPTTEKPR